MFRDACLTVGTLPGRRHGTRSQYLHEVRVILIYINLLLPNIQLKYKIKQGLRGLYK